MKGKLYAIGAAVLALLGAFLGILAAQRPKPAEYKAKLEGKTVKLHKKAANEAFKVAKHHTQKAKALAVQQERETSESVDDAIMKWNDDEL